MYDLLLWMVNRLNNFEYRVTPLRCLTFGDSNKDHTCPTRIILSDNTSERSRGPVIFTDGNLVRVVGETLIKDSPFIFSNTFLETKVSHC